MPVRAIRGATCLSADDKAEMSEAVAELLVEMLERNGITQRTRSAFYSHRPRSGVWLSGNGGT